MNERERAEQHLKTIRRLMERATIYRAISAPTALVGGLLSLVASGLIWVSMSEAVTPDRIAPNIFLWLWLVVLVLTAATNTLFIVLGAKKRNEPVFSASMKAAFTALAPSQLLAAAWTVCVAMMGWDPGLYFLTGIIWCACYGLGLLATGHFAPRSLTLLGWAFLLSAIVGLLYFSSFPDLIIHDAAGHPAILLMAATFGLFHLIYAVCAWPRADAEPET
jgi:hypothetical protein